MARKFLKTIFGRRNPVVPNQKTTASNFKPINPAQDIADFEYPPESSFYQDPTNTELKD